MPYADEPEAISALTFVIRRLGCEILIVFFKLRAIIMKTRFYTMENSMAEEPYTTAGSIQPSLSVSPVPGSRLQPSFAAAGQMRPAGGESSERKFLRAARTQKE